MKVIVSYNIKGGVGKTSIAVNLAYEAVVAGHRTLLWDLDEQGGAGAILGRPFEVTQRRARRSSRVDEHIEASAWPGLDIVPAEHLIDLLDRHDRPKRLRELLEKVANRYDRVFVDCPPTLGTLAEQIFELADLIVVPIIPATLSANAFEQLQRYREQRTGAKPELLPIYALVDRRRRAHRDALSAHPDRLSIPYASSIEQVAAKRRPIAELAPGSAAASAFLELSALVEERLR